MKLALIALLCSLSATSLAQNPSTTASPTPAFADPANLMGERVKPKDGRELPIDQGASGLQQLLRRLNTRASILNIVAHPDDEDGGMLTYYSRGLGARVADISLTRGEGGQNAVTGDFEDALGLLRTQELLANDRYTGVDQMFGTEVDFGFSKTKEEAFAKWTHDRVLYDVVHAVRLYRPLVLTATFIGGVTDGHGQHQVSGEIAQEAFDKAGDPTVFPEMIAEGILPWSPLKVYARVPMQAITDKGLYDYATNQYTPAKFTNYVTGEVTTAPPSADVIVHEGQTDPLLSQAAANPADLNPSATGNSQSEAASSKAADTTPLSYVQFARIGLGLQRSQIGGNFRVSPSGKFDVAYHLYGSHLCPSTTTPAPTATGILPRSSSKGKDPCTPAAAALPSASSDPEAASFFDGVDTSILGLQEYPAFPTELLPRLSGDLSDAAARFNPEHPELVAPALADALQIDEQILQLIEGSTADRLTKANALHEFRVKRAQLNEALSLALGIALDAKPDTDAANVPLRTGLNVYTPLSITSNTKAFRQGGYLTTSNGLRFSKHIVADYGGELLPNTPDTFYSKVGPEDVRLITRPYFTRDDIEQPVYKLLEPALRNAPATPPALIAWETVRYNGVSIMLGRVAHVGSQAMSIVPPVTVSLVNHAQIVLPPAKSFDISLSASPVQQILSVTASYAGEHGGDVHTTIKPEHGYLPPTSTLTLPLTLTRPVTVTASAATSASDKYAEGYRSIGYGDLPRTNYYTPATDRVVPVDLKLPSRHKLAYLAGTGDAVPEALVSVGLTPTMLTVADLTPANLAQYDTVILGVRTYAAHPELHGAPTQVLVDYAKAGGNVVVQYQTAEFTANDAPYPLALGSNEKVVDETAPVRLIDEKIDPGVRLFYAPNQITSADFDHWIEERGHGFLSTWDPHYSAPTETHDPGQDPQRGGLVTVKLGNDPRHQGRWTYCAFALYRQLPEAVPGAYRFFMNLLEPE